MKTVRTIVFVTVLVCTGTLQAQWWGNGKKVNGNGEVTSITRNTASYDQIKVHGSLDVSLVAGTEGNITIKGESNLIPHVITEVKGESLKIYVENGYYLNQSRNKTLIITVPFKDIDKVTLSGSGDVYSDAPIKASSFYTSVSGSGDVRLLVDAETIKSSVSGSGDLILSGTTEQLAANVTGSGDIMAYKLNAKNVDATVTGSGDVEVIATESIKARVTGSGDIDYKGNPSTEDKKVLGSGDITKQS